MPRTRHSNAADDLADLLRHASPDVAADNAAALAELRNAGALGGAAPAYRLTEAKHAAAPTEHDEQCALFAWADTAQAQHPELVMLYAVPNGGARHPAVGAQLKAEGVRAGYPDIALDVARGRWHGLRIELKRADRSNHATPEQCVWLERLRQYGYQAVVCYGAQEAINVITTYLDGDK